MAWDSEGLGALIAFVLATITTPAGVSGAVFLIPVQVSILGVPNPALTPTNLLYNVIATPGALLGYRRFDRRLVRLLAAGTVPGVIAGAILRVTVLDGPQVFFLVIAAVLLPLGAWLLLDRSVRRRSAAGGPDRRAGPGGGIDRGRLRDRGRVVAGAPPRRHGALGLGGGAGGDRGHLHDLRRRRDRVRPPLAHGERLDRSGLVPRDRHGPRRAGGRASAEPGSRGACPRA